MENDKLPQCHRYLCRALIMNERTLSVFPDLLQYPLAEYLIIVSTTMCMGTQNKLIVRYS